MDIYSKVCRACLCTEENFTYFLFNNVSSETYTFCTSLELVDEEKLPKSICNNCYELLTKYAEFKDTCIRTHNVLLSLCKSNEKNKDREQKLSMKLDPQYTQTVVLLENMKTEYDYKDHDDEPAVDKFSEDETSESSIRKQKRKPRNYKTSNKPKCMKNLLYTCELCSRRFGNSRTYEAHKKEHNGEKTSYPCAQCPKRFLTWSGLQRHLRSKHVSCRVSALACARCGRVCASRQTLAAHARTHARHDRLVCHECGLSLASPVVLKRHLETHRSNRERVHTCEHCGKKFFTNTRLLSHILRLHTDRRYICDYCQQPFTVKYNLAKHIQTHYGIKQHQCDICHKAFGRSSTLVEHKRIHSGEKPFICTLCSKGFLSKRQLRDHWRTHTGERPYKCDICQHSFTQRGSLQRHVKTHGKTATVKDGGKICISGEA